MLPVVLLLVISDFQLIRIAVRTRKRRQQAAYCLQKSGFAYAVKPGDGDFFSKLEHEIDFRQQGLAVAYLQIVDPQDRFAGGV